MKSQGRLAVLVAVVSVTTVGATAACVGDEGTNVTAAPDASSSDASTSADTGNIVDGTDAGQMGVDAGTDGAMACNAKLTVFGPNNPSFGVFCGPGTVPDASTSKQCDRGDHCCIPPASARICAASCGGGGGDLECIETQDCAQEGGVDGGPLVCCAESMAVLDRKSCSYPIFTTIHHGTCSATCGTQLQLCQTKLECAPGLDCVAAQSPYTGFGLAICQ